LHELQRDVGALHDPAVSHWTQGAVRKLQRDVSDIRSAICDLRDAVLCPRVPCPASSVPACYAQSPSVQDHATGDRDGGARGKLALEDLIPVASCGPTAGRLSGGAAVPGCRASSSLSRFASCSAGRRLAWPSRRIGIEHQPTDDEYDDYDQNAYLYERSDIEHQYKGDGDSDDDQGDIEPQCKDDECNDDCRGRRSSRTSSPQTRRRRPSSAPAACSGGPVSVDFRLGNVVPVASAQPTPLSAQEHASLEERVVGTWIATEDHFRRTVRRRGRRRPSSAPTAASLAKSDKEHALFAVGVPATVPSTSLPQLPAPPLVPLGPPPPGQVVDSTSFERSSLAALSARAGAVADRMGPEDVLATLSAFVGLEFLPGQEVLEAFGNRLEVLAAHMTSKQIGGVLHTYLGLRTRPSESLLAALAARAEQVGSGGVVHDGSVDVATSAAQHRAGASGFDEAQYGAEESFEDEDDIGYVEESFEDEDDIGYVDESGYGPGDDGQIMYDICESIKACNDVGVMTALQAAVSAGVTLPDEFLASVKQWIISRQQSAREARHLSARSR